MGHWDFRRLSRSARWRPIGELLASGADASEVAAAALIAAQPVLDQAFTDEGVVHSLWLSGKLAQAAGEDDPLAATRHLGLEVSSTPNALELAVAFTSAVDHHLLDSDGRSELGEIAQN